MHLCAKINLTGKPCTLKRRKGMKGGKGGEGEGERGKGRKGPLALFDESVVVPFT